MCRQKSAIGLFVLLVLTAQAQGELISDGEPCDGCNQSSEVGRDPHSEYLVRVYDIGATASISFSIMSNTSFADFELKPLNEYEITILGNGGQLYSMKISDLQRGPGQIRNFRLKSKSDTTAELRWDPPLYQTGAILKYTVSLKMNKMVGCSDFGRPTPSQDELVQQVTDTTMTFGDLHPYADYTAIVIAHTTTPGPPVEIDFRTSQSDIPTSIVSNLRYNESLNRLMWDKPADCTTISGSTSGVRLFIDRVSDSVKNLTTEQVTYYHFYNLDGLRPAPYELYRVRVHVIRHYQNPENDTLYQELIWRTLPAAPPAVTRLEIYDLDVDVNSISLRWVPPVPANGQIERYHVSIRSEDKPSKNWSIAVSEYDLNCRLWENYLCFERLVLPSNITTNWNRVEVYATNRNVTERGASASIVFTPDSLYNKEPSKPLNLRAIVRAQGLVTLKWSHPTITYTKLTRYRIRFEIFDTEVYADETPLLPLSVEYRVDLENRDYSVDVQLQRSTKYRIFLAAVNRHNFSSEEAQVEVSVPQSDHPLSSGLIKYA